MVLVINQQEHASHNRQQAAAQTHRKYDDSKIARAAPCTCTNTSSIGFVDPNIQHVLVLVASASSAATGG